MCKTEALLDRFVPVAEVRERHTIIIRAPAAQVMDVARNFQIESIWIVRMLFRLRARLMGERVHRTEQRLGLVEQMLGIGWQLLAEDPDHYLVAGAACRPWQVEPGFTPVKGDFALFAQPDRVKIAWTLEAAVLEPALTRFATETRVAAADEESRTKFRRYWRKFGAGIVLIRLVLLPAIRHRAEQLWRDEKGNELPRTPGYQR